jgi:hypothetical protein
VYKQIISDDVSSTTELSQIAGSLCTGKLINADNVGPLWRHYPCSDTESRFFKYDGTQLN